MVPAAQRGTGRHREHVTVGRPAGRAPINSGPPASVAQWKSSSVLRRGLGVRVPPGAQSLFPSDQVFFLWSDHSECVFARFLPAFRKFGWPKLSDFNGLRATSDSAKIERSGRNLLRRKLSNLLSGITGVGRTASADPRAVPRAASGRSVASRRHPDRRRRGRRRCPASWLPMRARASAARPSRWRRS